MKSPHTIKKLQFPDDELIKLCHKQNRTAQKLLFDKFSGKMMTICRRYARDRHEAEDFLQDSFIRVFKYLKQYKSQGSLEGWIRKTVVNTILRAIQNRAKFLYTELSSSEYEITLASDALDILENEEILLLIGQLPEGYRLIFNLYVLEGFTHKEIAETLGITESTSRSQLVRAKNSLRKSFIRLNKLSTNYHGSY